MTGNLTRVIAALLIVESGNRLDVPDGDKGEAVGVLQIHAAVVEDCNRIMGRQLWTLDDRRRGTHSINMCRVYLSYWAIRYTHATGKLPTLEIYARIWNGGPDGWRKDSTLAYWRKVKIELTR